MSVVVDLPRQNPIADHVGVIDAGGGFLVPGGVGIALKPRIDVAGHVPHVGDTRAERPQRAADRAPRRLFAVPEMDAVVVGRVHRIGRKNLVQEGIDGLMARKRQIALELPDAHHQERLGIQVFGKLVEDIFQAAEILPFALLLVAAGLKVRGQTIDPELFTAAGGFLLLNRFLDEALRPRRVVDVGHRQSPVSHRTIGIQGGNLPEGAFGLEKPEPVQLADALVEKLLGQGKSGRDGKMDFAGALHQIGLLPRPFVEDLPVGGMTGRHVVLFRLLRRPTDGNAQEKSRKNEPTNIPAVHGEILFGRSAGGQASIFGPDRRDCNRIAKPAGYGVPI